MSIEIGSKWVKDGELVEVKALTSSILVEVVWYSKNDEKEHVLTKDDFLEQYKTYEEPKQTVLIEKWLVEGRVLCSEQKYLQIVETSNINGYIKAWGDYRKLKLLYTYEVTL